MKTEVLRGSKQEIAESVVRISGEVREAIVFVEEPVRPKAWPEGFFDSIHISDPAFERPEQGQLPPMKDL